MRLAIVSDIHGNLPALQAVVEDIAASGAEHVINLGGQSVRAAFAEGDCRLPDGAALDASGRQP